MIQSNCHCCKQYFALLQVSVPTRSVRQGDVLRVLPGERVPVDGAVLTGRASADESMLTGEAALVPKSEGSQVTRAALNGRSLHIHSAVLPQSHSPCLDKQSRMYTSF
jgi:P-type E1-E2 ATPase